MLLYKYIKGLSGTGGAESLRVIFSAGGKEHIMAVEFNQLEASAKEKMDKSIAVFKSDLATIRAGRANPQVDRKSVV